MKSKGIYITGDKHGNFTEMLTYLNNIIPRDSVIIILGDVGLNYYDSIKDEINKIKLNESGYTFLCVRGNHEARPKGEETYISNDFFGGTFIVEKEYPNILYMMDGADYRFTVNGLRKKAIVIGGAYSVDKYYRLAKMASGYTGYKWFADEQLSEEECTKIMNKINQFNSYDYVLTHTCPYDIEPRDMFLPQVDQSTVDDSMELFLQKVSEKLTFDIWYCGHWHTDRTVKYKSNTYRFMYNVIEELGV